LTSEWGISTYENSSINILNNTVDRRNPAPPGMYETLSIMDKLPKKNCPSTVSQVPLHSPSPHFRCLVQRSELIIEVFDLSYHSQELT